MPRAPYTGSFAKSLRSGIRGQFPKPATYLKLLGGAVTPDLQAARARIAHFAREGEFTHRYAPDLPEMPYAWPSLASDLATVASKDPQLVTVGAEITCLFK